MNKYDDDIQLIKFSDNKKSSVQNRLKSKVVWTSVTATILMLIGHLGLYKKIGITESSLQILIDGILNILVLFGILNNPSDSTKF